MSGIDETFAFLDWDDIVISKRRENGPTEHIAEANNRMVMPSTIRAGRILDQVKPRLPLWETFHGSRAK